MNASFELIATRDMDFPELFHQSETFFDIKYHEVSIKYATAVDSNRELMLNITPKALHFTLFNKEKERDVINDIARFVSLNFKGKLLGVRYYSSPDSKLTDYIDNVNLIML